MALLHGEQHIINHKPLPIASQSNLKIENEIIDVADKTSGALLTIKSTATDQDKGELISTNYAKLFIRGIGGFGHPGNAPKLKFPEASGEMKT